MSSPPTDLIIEAMSQLSKKDKLGHANQPRKDLELAFQIRLCELLNVQNSGWKWRREFGYKTGALRNHRNISIDLVGNHESENKYAAVELKYAPTKENGAGGSDPLAFPYDLLKDCLKIELLNSDLCEPKNGTSPSRFDFGYSIGLTNIPRIVNCSMQGWSRNYTSTISADGVASTGNCFSFGPCQIETVEKKGNTSELERIIYKKGLARHHISLGMKWSAQWLDFPKPENLTPFKYILLSTLFGDNGPSYTHDHDSSEFVPFLKTATRNEAMKIAEKFE
jgi:hypothetical protein